MKHYLLAPMAALAFGLVSAPASAQDAFVEHQTITPELAQTMATAAMDSCREKGAQVGVTVVDRFGIPQAFIRDRFAGLHVYETSRRKAWTSVSFRSSTTELSNATSADKGAFGIRFLSEALPLGGGLVVYSGEGAIVAGIGVSGAPSPDMDEDCAIDGIAAIEDEIAF